VHSRSKWLGLGLGHAWSSKQSQGAQKSESKRWMDGMTLIFDKGILVASPSVCLVGLANWSQSNA